MQIFVIKFLNSSVFFLHKNLLPLAVIKSFTNENNQTAQITFLIVHRTEKNTQ